MTDHAQRAREIASNICDCPIGNKKQVLTLDQIEEWVKAKLATLHSDPSKQRRLYGHGRCIYSDIIDDLLAQVQAWREATCQKRSG